jgi:hypothetical protein
VSEPLVVYIDAEDGHAANVLANSIMKELGEGPPRKNVVVVLAFLTCSVVTLKSSEMSVDQAVDIFRQAWDNVHPVTSMPVAPSTSTH